MRKYNIGIRTFLSRTFGEVLSTERVLVATVSVAATPFFPVRRSVVADRRVDHFSVELKQVASVPSVE